jgi:hypothetical protein
LWKHTLPERVFGNLRRSAASDNLTHAIVVFPRGAIRLLFEALAVFEAAAILREKEVS